MLNLVALKALPWRWIAIGLLVAALVVQTLRLDTSQERVKRVKAEHAALVDRMKAEAKRQRETTKANVERAREGMKQVEGPAKQVETAPLGPREKCETPAEIMGADL